MPTEVIFKPHLSVGGNDISAFVKSLTLDYSVQLKDFTASGDLNTINKGGLKDWSISAELFQDFAAAALDSILEPLLGTDVAIEIRKSTDAVSTSNPKYTGTAVLAEYPPLSAAVGDESMSTISLASASALVRATS